MAAVVAVAGIAACSSGPTGQAAGQHLAEAAASSQSKAPSTTPAAPTTTVAPTTTAAPTTTSATVAPPKTTAPAANQQVTQAATAVSGVPCSAAVRACVDLATHQAWLVSAGKVVYGPVSIMPGSASFPTPSGTFHVLSKNAHYWSREFKAPMPDAVFFYPGDAFHVGSLRVYSHGCIHLSWSAAATFFQDLSVGDVVQVLR